MAELNKLVIDKIESMDTSEERKKLIRTLFETQLRIGSDPKMKTTRVNNFRDSILRSMRK